MGHPNRLEQQPDWAGVLWLKTGHPCAAIDPIRGKKNRAIGGEVAKDDDSQELGESLRSRNDRDG